MPLLKHPGSKLLKIDWIPAKNFKEVMIHVLKLITFFTIAHALSLTVVVLDILVFPSSVFEAIIALSIALSAFHILRPIFSRGEWLIAFIFGLFHGFGFAEILLDIGLRGEHIALSLIGFNLGVELGHIVIVILVLPILYVLRKKKIFPTLLVYSATILIAIGLYWFMSRILGYDTILDSLITKIIGRFFY